MKWYTKCFIYWTADLKSSELCNCYANASELCNCLNCVHNCDDHSSLEHYYWPASSRKFLMIALCLLILAGRYHRHFCLLYWKPSSFFNLESLSCKDKFFSNNDRQYMYQPEKYVVLKTTFPQMLTSRVGWEIKFEGRFSILSTKKVD